MAATRVQTRNGSVASGTSFAITWTSNTTTGNLIVVVVGVGSSIVSSITDSQSNTYAKATSSTANNNSCEIWYAQNITGGTTPTITVNLSGASPASGIAREYSGLAAAAFDRANAASGVAGSASSGATAATTQANELVVGGVSSVSFAPSVGSGYSNLTTNTTVSSAQTGIEDKDVTSTGAQTATFGNTSGIWSAAVATFKESGGGGGVTATVSTSMMMGVG